MVTVKKLYQRVLDMPPPPWYKKLEPLLTTMRVFLLYEGVRSSFEVPRTKTVGQMKDMIRDKFLLGSDDGKPNKRVMVLNYGGADLQDHWCLSNMGVKPNATIKVTLRKEIKPILFVECTFNQEVVKIIDDTIVDISFVLVRDVRTYLMKKTGLPVGVFRLVTILGEEMYDTSNLGSYGIDRGDTIRLQTWDGWNDFLNLAINGFTSHALSRLSTDEKVSRYQQKVALFIAAHYGHIDLALSLLRQGIKANESVGDHPSRQWCSSTSHIGAKTTPIHEAAAVGQMGIVRTFVTHDICVIAARDGQDLKPLNIALRSHQKACSTYLLTKQWSRVSYDGNVTVPVSIYIRTKKWCDRAKNKVWLTYGFEKSSYKRRPQHEGAFVGQGVHIDGFTTSQMTSSPREPTKLNRYTIIRLDKDRHLPDVDVYFRTEGAKQFKLPNTNKWDRMTKGKGQKHENPETTERKGAPQIQTLKNKPITHNRSASENSVNSIKLPPLQVKVNHSTQNLSTLLEDISEPGATPRNTGSPSSEFMTSSEIGHRRESPRETESEEAFVVDKVNSALDERGRICWHRSNVARKKRERTIRSAVRLAKVKNTDSVPLPMISVERKKRPFFHSTPNANIVHNTLDLYEKYRGLSSRDYAIKCLSMANHFKEKPWLDQVRLAMDLSRQQVHGRLQKQQLFQ